MKWLERYAAIAGCLVVALSAAGCNDLELKSSWRDRDITIDGDARDWRGLTTYVEKGNIAVGVANDGEDLYLCLHTPTREVAGQILMRGLTVWFDPGGGRKLGFRCPIGAEGMPRPAGEKMEREDMEDRILDMVGAAAGEVEVLGADDKVYGRFATADVQGLQIALGYTDGRIVYEIKLPLDKTEERPYALGVDWEKKVSIGFVTPEVDMEAMRASMDDGPPDGVRGGGMRGGGPGGGMPGGRPGGMRGGLMPEAVDLWCTVDLARAAREEGSQE